MYLFFVAIGLGIIGIAFWRQPDDIPFIAALAAGFLLLLGGFVTMPTPLQIAIELLGLGIVLFPLRSIGGSSSGR